MTKIIIYSFLICGLLTACKEKKPEAEKQKPEATLKKDTIMKDSQEPPAAIVKKENPRLQKTYKVQKDDWLWQIARNEYGTAIAWFRIYEANMEKIKDPDLIYPGQVFIIPEFKRRKK